MTLRIDVITLFPGLYPGPLGESIAGRALSRGLAELRTHDLREWGIGRHRSVDDYPYGGGAGMVLRPEPIAAALDAVAPRERAATLDAAAPPDVVAQGDVVAARERAATPDAAAPRDVAATRILLDPGGGRFDQALAAELAARARLVLVCPRYEGVDDRIRSLVDLEISIGDYVLSGGDLPAMVVIDAVLRLLPGAIDEASQLEESFSEGLLEYPQFTRPPEFRGARVPDVLVSGHHGQIARWRREQAVERTRQVRPDLLPPVEAAPAAGPRRRARRSSAEDAPPR